MELVSAKSSSLPQCAVLLPVMFQESNRDVRLEWKTSDCRSTMTRQPAGTGRSQERRYRGGVGLGTLKCSAGKTRRVKYCKSDMRALPIGG